MSAEIQKAIARTAIRRLGQLHTTLSSAGLIATAIDGRMVILEAQTGEILAMADSPLRYESQSSQTSPQAPGEVDE